MRKHQLERSTRVVSSLLAVMVMIGCDRVVQAGGEGDAGGDAGTLGMDAGTGLCSASASVAGSVNGLTVAPGATAAFQKSNYEYISIGQNILQGNCCVNPAAAPVLLYLGFSAVTAGIHPIRTFAPGDAGGVGAFGVLYTPAGAQPVTAAVAESGPITIARNGDRWTGSFTLTFASAQQLTGTFDASATAAPLCYPPVDAGCPLSAQEWFGVKRATEDAVSATLNVTANSQAGGIGARVTPLFSNFTSGTKWGWVDGTPCAPKPVSCQSDNPSDPDPFWNDHDACFELTCESPSVFKARAFWTMRPIRLPSVGHPYSYPLSAGRTLTYTPNPNIVWTIDKGIGIRTTVSASMLNNVLLKYPDGGVNDFTHVGTAEAVAEPGGVDAPDSLDVDLSFTRLRAQPITTAVELDATKKPKGSVELSGQVLGTFTSQAAFDNWNVTYSWTGVCGN
jgi:hypothetical protein